MPYAIDGQISQTPLDSGIEITENEYKKALQAQLNGKKIAVRSEGMRILSREMITVYNKEDKSEKQIPENEDIPDGYTDFIPSEHDYWDGSQWVEDTEAKEQAEIKDNKDAIVRELEAIDRATIRPERAIRAAEIQGNDPAQADIDRLRELEDAAVKLRKQRGDSGTIDWTEWRK